MIIPSQNSKMRFALLTPEVKPWQKVTFLIVMILLCIHLVDLIHCREFWRATVAASMCLRAVSRKACHLGTVLRRNGSDEVLVDWAWLEGLHESLMMMIEVL